MKTKRDIILKYLDRGIEVNADYVRKDKKYKAVFYNGIANLIYKDNNYFIALREVSSENNSYLETG
jgi:hypothetical protein